MGRFLSCKQIAVVAVLGLFLQITPGHAITSPYVTVAQDVPLNQSTTDDLNGRLALGSHTPQEGAVSRLTDATSATSPTADVIIAPDNTWAHVTWDLGGTPEEIERRRLDRVDVWISGSDALRKGFHGSIAVSRDGQEFWVIPNSRHHQVLSQNSRYNRLRYDFPAEFMRGSSANRDRFPVTNFRYLRLNSRGATVDDNDWQSRFVEIDAWVSQASPEEPEERDSSRYQNPVRAHIDRGFGRVEITADPTILYAEAEGRWYVTSTAGPLNSYDLNGDTSRRTRLFPLLVSDDLVNWDYIGDAFSARPSWTASNAHLWAPELMKHGGLYYLYYTVVQGDQSAIGVATALSPSGPWVDKGPVIDFRSDRWQYDPEVVVHEGERYLFFGSYRGGLVARKMTPDGLRTLPETEFPIVLPGRYEAAKVIERNGYWYLFGSATDCCRGALTGYSVFVGRADHPLGPYVDREGAAFLDGHVGGTPVLGLNGNRWIGPGHNDVFTDFAGQDWILYHAVDRSDPYSSLWTKRSLMLDPLDWVDGWPTTRGGLWASDGEMPAPAAQPTGGKYRMRPAFEAELGERVWREDFNGGLQNWTWVREPAAGQFTVSGGIFSFATQAADLHEDMNNASVLLRALPTGDWMVEASFNVDVPPKGAGFNFVQGGLVIYRDDDRYIKLVKSSIDATRQIEFAKEVPRVDSFLPRYGNTVGAAAGNQVWARIIKQEKQGEEHYTAYSSRDGISWTRAGTWIHDLGAGARIGLVAMGGSGFNARFDYVEVRRLRDSFGVKLGAAEADGAIPLRLRARAFRNYLFEVSPDLINWSPLVTQRTDWDGGIEILDEAAEGAQRRFYRAR